MNSPSQDHTSTIPIEDREFEQFQHLLFEQTGIYLAPAKKPLLTGRLNQRLRQLGIRSYAVYYRAIVQQQLPGEMQILIDRLTTNETSFFREPKHFDFLRRLCQTLPQSPYAMRVWCAACSTGEEPYSAAMVMNDAMHDKRWEIVATDINSQVLQQARLGHYPLARSESIPKTYLQRYCLKGTGNQSETFIIGPELRTHIQFRPINLITDLPALGQFDVIFLRNVLIYFPIEIKQRVIENLKRLLKTGGYFIVGHSESLLQIVDGLESVAPSIYRRV